jgi:hypothetical protein
MPESFTDRVARLAAQRVEAPEPKPPEPEHDPDLIPEVDSGYERTETDLEIDRIIDKIDILDAYALWCGKMTPKVGKKRESIMISCPKPEHPDVDPSAWINLDKQTWFCGGCNEGGDKFDIAAMHFGIYNYKDGKNFVELRKRIAESQGYTVYTTPSGTEHVIAPESDGSDVPPAGSSSEPLNERNDLSDFSAKVRAINGDKSVTEPAAAPPEEPAALAPVLTIVPDAPETPSPGDPVEYPVVPWRDFLTDNTFLRRWMTATTQDDVTEEYYFWLGLTAVGIAAGRDCTLADSPPVTGNLFVCLFGPSGDGKSRSMRPLVELLSTAIPYDPDDEYSTGAMLVPTPGSAEALIDSFSKPVYDPSDPKKLLSYAPVRGLVRMDELAGLLGRSARSGSVFKPTLMEFFDCYNRVELKTRGTGHVIAEQPFASFITTSQPRAIRDLVRESDARSGFLNRWIIACGRNKRKVSFGRKAIDISRCIDPLREIRAWASSHSRITMSDEALDVWDTFFQGVLEPERRGDDTDLITRTDLMLKKVMLLLALDRREAEISATTVVDAISLWEYLCKSYRLLNGEIGAGVMDDAKDVILDAVARYEEKNGKGITMRELNRVLQRARIPIEVTGRLLPILVRYEMLHENVIKPDRGPTTTRYTVVS